MRLFKGGVAHVASMIEEDLEERDIDLAKPHLAGLADIAASILSCRSVNTSEIASVLPREVKSEESRQRYIFRWLNNAKIHPPTVMNGMVPELLELVTAQGQTASLMLDQSKIAEGFECLMVSLRTGERALPVAWKVKQTQGAIGFKEQEELLRVVKKMIPVSIRVMIAADRFYGTAALIGLCQELGFSYRVRLKGNLTLVYEDAVITTGEAVALRLSSLEQATLGTSSIATNIGIIHEAGHPEPWIIAMDSKPTAYKTLDYGLIWGIEAMFSDFKTRGFNVMDTQLKTEARIERLLLVLTIAMFWALSTGLRPKSHKQPSKKKRLDA